MKCVKSQLKSGFSGFLAFNNFAFVFKIAVSSSSSANELFDVDLGIYKSFLLGLSVSPENSTSLRLVGLISVNYELKYLFTSTMVNYS